MEVAFGFWFWGGFSCSDGGLKRPLKRGTTHYFSRTWESGAGCGSADLDRAWPTSSGPAWASAACGGLASQGWPQP